MNLYDSIKSPFEDDGILKRLIDIYSDMDESNDDLYSEIIVDNDMQNFDRDKYIRDYEKLIVNPTFEELYNNLKTRVDSGENVWNVGLENWQQVFNKCKTYSDLDAIIKQVVANDEELKVLQRIGNSTAQVYDVIENGALIWGTIQNDIEEAIEIFSKEILQQITPYVVIQNNLKSQLKKVNKSVMGFHVNAKKVMDPIRENEENEIKFYINAGDDTCKIAEFFREKCKEQNLNYYFKVANPYDNEEDRTDKLCIYSSLNDAQKYFEILQEIKKENPQISFKKPPILTAKVDEWLGIASDYKGDRKIKGDTYNNKMSDIVVDSINNTLKGISRKDIPENIKNNSDLMDLLKKEIITMASQIGYSKEKLSVRKSDKKILKNGSRFGLFDRMKGIFSKRKQLSEPQSETKIKKQNNDFLERIRISNTKSTQTRTMDKKIPSKQIGFQTKSDGEEER